ncbi:hypothetical protein [Actinobacillus ureae]|uniref:hypothetical protein n=1 Tax=Actinobacillus ureae TaxID=723 RepID=UPI000E20316D|nr:hypothetical protein [Actinobacillus ureae]
MALKFLISRQQEQPKIDYEALPKRPRLPQRPHVMAGTHAEGVTSTSARELLESIGKAFLKTKNGVKFCRCYLQESWNY